MTITLALRLSGAVLALSLLALAADIGVYLLHIPVAPKTKQTLDIAAFVWPLALVFFGTYQRKAAAAAENQNSPR